MGDDKLRISLESKFHDRFEEVEKEYAVCEAELGEGTPIFTVDEIYATGQDLDIFLRSIFVDLGITREYFHTVFHKYARVVLGLHGTQIANKKGNLMKALLNGNITIQRFMFTLRALGLNTTNFMVELNCPEGTKVFDLKRLKHHYRDTGKDKQWRT